MAVHFLILSFSHSLMSYLTFVREFVIESILFPFETCEQGVFFSENFPVNLYSVKIFARAFEKSVAITIIDSTSYGSDSHCET